MPIMNRVSRRSFMSALAVPLLPGQLVSAVSDQPEPQQSSHLNPDFKPDKRVDELMRDLAAPLHGRLLRDRARRVFRGQEADLSQGYILEMGDSAVATRLAVSTADFEKFMSASMDLQHRLQAYPIRLRTGVPEGCPPLAPEAYHVQVTEAACTVTARDAEGARRALIWLEDEMLIRRAPCLPLGSVSRWAVVEDRITRSPVAPYRFLTGWELEQDEDYYPDEYLNKLAHCGMNGIWVAGLLSRMVATRSLPEVGPEAHRLETLKRLCAKAARYGIKVYLFCMEPRAMPRDHPVFAAHPEIRGAAGQSLCVSTPLVQQYIRELMRELFTAVPELGGVINIFNGERITTCWWDQKYVQTCPRCRERTQLAVLTDDLNCFMQGIRQASATGKFIAWDCGADRTPNFSLFLKDLHPDVVWMGNFEHDGYKIVDGKRVEIHEYSLSFVGPSEPFAAVAQASVRAVRQVYAKWQIGNTYELSSVPYIPVPQVVYDKLAAAQTLHVSGAMIGWIIGGYPSLMLKAAGEASFAPLVPRDQALHRLAALYGDPTQAEVFVRAWERFSVSFHQYLCSPHVFYYGPITRCPSYQLHLEQESQLAEPYNWGITRIRQKQPYEDKFARWLGPFTAEELIRSFRQMGDQWMQGLSVLSSCVKQSQDDPELRRQYAIAAAARLQFLSMANVLDFYSMRDRLREAPAAEQAALVPRMRAVVENDIALAKEMKSHLALDPFIGFESENYNYSYSETLLEDKIVHDTATVRTLARWEKSGVEPEVLSAVLPTSVSTTSFKRAPASWRDWLRWGED